jgi:hypothetical protein
MKGRQISQKADLYEFVPAVGEFDPSGTRRKMEESQSVVYFC